MVRNVRLRVNEKKGAAFVLPPSLYLQDKNQSTFTIWLSSGLVKETKKVMTWLEVVVVSNNMKPPGL